MDGASIGERVREGREKRGWSARTLAGHAGVSHAYVSHLEAGQYTRPGVEQLRRIAAALGTSVEKLIGEGAGEQGEASSEKVMLEGMQINLMTIGELDPDALDQLAGIIAAVKEKVERDQVRGSASSSKGSGKPRR